MELPGRGVTRVWECPGPRDAPTLMLIHGVACTAELKLETAGSVALLGRTIETGRIAFTPGVAAP